jgi:hypothetical protein
MVDVNKPVTNPELVTAIKVMKENNTKENQDNVINKVMEAHFISPVLISPVQGTTSGSNEVVLKENTTINFSMIENTANQQFFLAFTDWEELGKWQKNKNQQTLIMTFDDLASMILHKGGNSEGFVINPFSENIVFNKAMIGTLMEEKERHANGGVIEQVVNKDTTVQLGEPRVYPKEMVNAISNYLKKQKNVQAAYLQLMIKEGEQSYLVIVDFSGDRRILFDGIANVAMSHLKGMYIDLIPYDSDFGLNAAKNIEPFYKKKKFGIF